MLYYNIQLAMKYVSFFLWLKFKFTEETTNHKQNQVEARYNINITIKRILQRYTMVKHKTSFQQ